MNAPHDVADDAIINSSGNVFADLGVKLSAEEMLKVEIARAINNTIHKRKLTQAEAAKRMDIDQPKVSNLLRGRLEGFSTERLIRFLLLLGRDIDIHISKYRDHEDGRLKVRAA